MNEIVHDIFTWVWFSEPHGYNFNGHLVRHPAGNLCIDPVPPSDADLSEIVRMGVTTIVAANPGSLVTVRTAYRRSCQTPRSHPVLACPCTTGAGVRA